MLTFRKATPESVGIPSAAVADFVRDLLDARHCLHTLSVIKDGALIFEGAFSPMTLDEPHRLYSCSKSFVSVAIGLAQSEGLLRLTDRVAQFFPEYDTPDLHPWLKTATLRDMLRMTDCHSENTYHMDKNPPDMDWVDTWFRTPPSHRPGTIFEYNTTCTVMLCVILERVTGQTFVDYLRPRVFEKLGMSPDIQCVRTPCGHAWGGSGVLCSARDFAKFAYLCMHMGELDGVQILPRDYMEEATAYQIDNTLNEDNWEHQQGYGYQLWRSRGGGFSFYGMGSQQGFCYPERDLLVVITGDTQAMPSAREIQLQSVRRHLLRPACAPLPEDPAAYADLIALQNSLTLRTEEGAFDSPLAPSVSDRVYTFPENELGWKTARLALGRTGLLSYENATGAHEIPFGFGKPVQFELSEPSTYTMDIGHPGGRTLRAFASAAWKDPRTLHLTVYVCDVCFGTLQLTLRFDDDALTVAAKKNAEWFLNEYQGYATSLT